MDRRNLPKTRQTLVDLGNELRSKYGDHILARRTIEILQGKIADLIIIDGIRNLGEVQELKKLKPSLEHYWILSNLEYDTKNNCYSFENKNIFL